MACPRPGRGRSGPKEFDAIHMAKTPPDKSRVLIVDDHPLFREGMRQMINRHPSLKVCGEEASPEAAMKAVAELEPDLVLVDISLEGGDGIDLIKSLKARYEDLPILVISMHNESLYAERALRAGARGYLMKREAAKKVIQGIRTVLAGQLFVSEKVAALMAERFVEGGRPPASPEAALSDRELEVFQLLGRGLSTRQIADHLHVGFKTVQAYAARIKEKLQLANATELLRAAMQWNENHPAE